MNNSFKFGVCFLLGAGTGFAAGWLYFKKKYELKADEEIEEMRNYFKSKEVRKATENIKNNVVDYLYDTVVPEKPVKEEPDEIPEYGNMFNNIESHRPPYVISPEEFYEEENYEKITLTYFGLDHILADDENCMVEDIASAVGTDWENRIGEYVQSAVYVRNDKRQCDYEILYVEARYLDD